MTETEASKVCGKTLQPCKVLGKVTRTYILYIATATNLHFLKCCSFCFYRQEKRNKEIQRP